MSDAKIIEFAENPKKITVEDYCARENLSQKRTLGHMIYRRLFEDPTFVFDSPEEVEAVDDPGKAEIFDNWQAEDYAAKNRLPDLHAQAPIV